ncbi:tetratricopeptide repeat protein [Alteraurantiacibacter aquimixticola]|uniref:Uncharacterized protein n=1 Tax=Alteraurantiacibacter aquimixticola TaxID=2489173 RepID=A0A4T3F7Z0_9SPHN|nr:hypothetical protein [Alteraurantiacibacter aquimixticola]TIX51852.1 hypothetical protein E5222_05260 [Alteraurantiacibacter aquimixticola]
MRFLVAAVAALMLALPAQAQDWWYAETAHFIIKSRSSKDDTLEFAAKVERFDRGMRFLQGLPEDHVEESHANKPIIYRLRDPRTISRLAGAGGGGVLGFFIPRAGHSVGFAPVRQSRSNNSRARRDRTSDPNETLFHEYTHYFMMQNVPATYPRWYSEGYAEMMSTMRFHDDGSFHIGDPPQDRYHQVMEMSQSRLNEMLDNDHEVNFVDYIQHYGTGWLLTHYLSFDVEREAKLREFLFALGNGEDSLTAAERIFGDLNELQREILRYRRDDFPGYNVRPNLLAEPEVSIRPIEGAEDAAIQEEMELWIGVSEDEAAGVAAKLRAVVAEYPDSAHAYMLLAEAEHDAGKLQAAQEAAARAVELDPENQHAWLYRGRIALKMAEDDPAQYEVARDHIASARTIDLDDPRPLIDYYESYYEESGGQDIPEHAIIALEQAYDTAGSDTRYRLLLGRQLVNESRFQEATVVMLPALFSGHSFDNVDEDDFTPNRLFTALEAQDRTRALELINKVLEPEEEED